MQELENKLANTSTKIASKIYEMHIKTNSIIPAKTDRHFNQPSETTAKEEFERITQELKTMDKNVNNSITVHRKRFQESY